MRKMVAAIIVLLLQQPLCAQTSTESAGPVPAVNVTRMRNAFGLACRRRT